MDRVDDLLAAHFSVEPAPAELASRIVRRAHDAEREVGRLLDEIEIAATDRGVCLVRAERLAPPPSAKARRLVEQARVELAEDLQGKRTFFAVPVDLSGVPAFQRRVLEVARRIPFGTPVKDRLLALERSTPVLEGCATTRIVCRVGCVHGRHMRPENRVVFASVADARSVGYRPCKVCRPAAAA